MAYATIEKVLTDTLRPRQRPVAVAFRDSAPPGVPDFAGTEPSGCSFWRLAALGRTFCTRPADHYNCPVGSYTHNLAMPAERAAELERTLGLMTGAGYLKMEEVAAIPRLERTPSVIIYAPLADTPVEPDVVLVASRPGRLMLLHEAATRAGVGLQAGLLGRPTCMALPAALTLGVVASLGCVGNRIYTDLPEEELYTAIPGKDLARIVDEMKAIVSANAALSEYHQARRQDLATQ